MAAKLISDFLMDKGISNINSIEFATKDGGYNLGSVNEFVVVTFTDERNDLHLFLKICKRGSFIAEVNPKLFVFDKENLFYNELLPSFVKFQSDRMPKIAVGVESMCFKSFGSGVVDEDIYIVLEKFCEDKYYVTKIDEFHTEEQIHCAMKSIAGFHAVSYCMENIEKFNFLERYPILEDKLFHPDTCKIIGPLFISNYKTNLKLIKAIIDGVKANNPLVKKYQISSERLKDSGVERLENLSEKIMNIFHQICSYSDENAVVCHGDFHMGNVAFNKEDKNKLKLFDFQLIHYASGILDIHQYLSQVSSPKTRDSHLDSFLQSYCDAFKVACDQLGLDKELNIFTINYVTKEYRRTSPWGFLYGFVYLMYRFVPPEVYARLPTIESNNEIIDILNGVENVSGIIELYIEFILEAESNGVIDIMEKLISH